MFRSNPLRPLRGRVLGRGVLLIALTSALVLSMELGAVTPAKAVPPMTAMTEGLDGPSTILRDPTTTAGDFGYSVAFSGRTAVVGSNSTTPNGNGEAFVYTKGVHGWSTPPVVLPAPMDGSESFGSAVATTGSTAVVGAAESAYVYVKGRTRWPTSPTVSLADPGGGVNDGFGLAVAMSGSTIIIGAPYAVDGSRNGRVYLYVKGPSGWPSTPTVTLADPEPSGYWFGLSVAASGASVIVGARNVSTIGAAYIFTKGSHSWPTTPTASMYDPVGTLQGCFGQSVALSDRIAVIGAGCDIHPGGRVYVYTDGSSGWVSTATATLTDPHPDLTNDFGSQVAVTGGVVGVGAYGALTSTGGSQAGTVFFYTKSRSGWPTSPTTSLHDPRNTREDSFGFALAMSSGRAFIGACNTNVNIAPGAGAAYFYRV